MGHEAEYLGMAPYRGTRAVTARVLVVDDEPDVEALFRQQFRREVREGFYTLDFALSALAALAILDGASGEKIILLVSDINMPGMSGLDLLLIVKTRRPDLPVFMISAYGDADTVATALGRGADEFLTKPVDFPKLKQDIMAVMADATGETDDRATDHPTNDPQSMAALQQSSTRHWHVRPRWRRNSLQAPPH